MSENQPSTRSRRAGGWLMWFATLGGALAWTVHLLAAWSINELACAGSQQHVAGVPLRLVLAIATVLPAVLVAAALAVSWRAWRRTSAVDDERALDRARMLAAVGLWANLLFLAIILFGGAAILVFPPCLG